MQGGLKVKRSLFSLAIACLAVAAAVPASAQINTNGLPNTDHVPFNLAEAYPCTAGTYADSLGLTPLKVFTGTCPAQASAPSAAPGILSLKRNGTAIDVNCFAVTPAGEFNCVVQAFRLFKMVPGSFKCPDVYGLPHFDTSSPPKLLPYTYIQFGSGVRTWWALNFTQPGTRFLLQVVSACQFQPTMPVTTTTTDPKTGVTTTTTTFVPIPNTGQQTHIHVDSWRWRVTADENTLLNLINLMHSGAVSTLEVPCILGEDMYDALVTARNTLAGAIAEADDASHTRLTDVGNAIFNMEALIVANCLFVEVLNPLVAFPGPAQFGAPNIQPPGNLAASVSFGQSSAVAGIIDTIEHPCCCKLLVDLEWITLRQGLAGTSPMLPTF
jgi:hypothetical protein